MMLPLLIQEKLDFYGWWIRNKEVIKEYCKKIRIRVHSITKNNDPYESVYKITDDISDINMNNKTLSVIWDDETYKRRTIVKIKDWYDNTKTSVTCRKVIKNFKGKKIKNHNIKNWKIGYTGDYYKKAVEILSISIDEYEKMMRTIPCIEEDGNIIGILLEDYWRVYIDDIIYVY